MLETARKKPTQARAVQTVEILLDAAAQVLEHEDERHFTTNRVAEVAGFSIGTLYQYFPNKNAIATALAMRERDRAKLAFQRAMARAAPHDLEAVIRILVRTSLNVLGGRRRARRMLMIRMVRLNQGIGFLRSMDELNRAFVDAIAAHGLPDVRPLSETAAFVLTRAIMGAVRAALLEETPLMAEPSFEAELVQMALRFVRN